VTDEGRDKSTARIYFRGHEEVADYERIKDDARSLDLSFSQYAKNVLSDPLWPLKRPKLFVRFASLFVPGPYDKLDTMVKVLGGVPDRDQIHAEGQKMSCDQLLTGLKAHNDLKRLLEIYEEVWRDLYRQKMEQQHGVVIDEIRV